MKNEKYENRERRELSAEIVLLIGLQIKNRILKDIGNEKSRFYVKYVVFFIMIRLIPPHIWLYC